jgi:hypothetical protein
MSDVFLIEQLRELAVGAKGNSVTRGGNVIGASVIR